jgi:hypothetical protein
MAPVVVEMDNKTLMHFICCENIYVLSILIEPPVETGGG